MWSRRQFLSALGAAGVGGALGPLIGCGSAATRRPQTIVTRIGEEELLTALSILDAKLEGARIFSRQNTSDFVSLDHEHEQYDRHREHLLVLSGQREGLASSIVLRNPSSDELLLAATRLSGHAIARPMRLATLQDVRGAGRDVLRHSEYRDAPRQILASAQGHGSSRIIYRSVYLRSVHCEQRLISRSQNLRVDSRRTRAGVVMAAWARGEIATGQIEVSGPSGPNVAHFADDALEAVADRTLAHLYARSAPTGPQDVILCPEASAMLANHGIGQARAQRPAPQAGIVRVTDDPGVGYGTLIYDDEGRKASPVLLVGTGAAEGPMPARRRVDDQGQLRLMPTHVRVEPGEHSLDDLVAGVKVGVLLEGPELCSLDQRGERVALLASRGREIRDGRFTGRVFARTLTSFALSEFISTTVALGNQPTTLAFDDHGIASSAEAPHWLGHARVEAA